MHVLALSGLHIGIAFAIIYKIMAVLILLPGGHIARNLLALIFIVGYTVLSGCSPSVIRAATMIFIYKIAAGSFRKIGSLEAIALAAMITCIISPLQVKSIGFQLSYCAVMGIAMLFPTCNGAFKQMVPQWKGYKKFLWKGIYWLWCSIAISVCCQIATLPASLYHFGHSAPYFLLANLVAVPLATGILYTLTLTLCLQWIPFVGEWCIELLNMLISLLNSAVMYISG
jgi:competence protein ComEC